MTILFDCSQSSRKLVLRKVATSRVTLCAGWAIAAIAPEIPISDASLYKDSSSSLRFRPWSEPRFSNERMRVSP
jgi:hypothetical protein